MLYNCVNKKKCRQCPDMALISWDLSLRTCVFGTRRADMRSHEQEVKPRNQGRVLILAESNASTRPGLSMSSLYFVPLH